MILARVPHEENVLHAPTIEPVLDIAFDRARVREPAVEFVVDVFDVREEHAVALAPPPGGVLGAARHEIPVGDDERLVRPGRFAETRRRVDGDRAHRETGRGGAPEGDEPARRRRFAEVDREPVAAPGRDEIRRAERAIRRAAGIRDIDEKAAVRGEARNGDRGGLVERIHREFEPVAARDEERRVRDREIVDEILVVRVACDDELVQAGDEPGGGKPRERVVPRLLGIEAARPERARPRGVPDTERNGVRDAQRVVSLQSKRQRKGPRGRRRRQIERHRRFPYHRPLRVIEVERPRNRVLHVPGVRAVFHRRGELAERIQRARRSRGDQGHGRSCGLFLEPEDVVGGEESVRIERLRVVLEPERVEIDEIAPVENARRRPRVLDEEDRHVDGPQKIGSRLVVVVFLERELPRRKPGRKPGGDERIGAHIINARLGNPDLELLPRLRRREGARPVERFPEFRRVAGVDEELVIEPLPRARKGSLHESVGPGWRERGPEAHRHRQPAGEPRAAGVEDERIDPDRQNPLAAHERRPERLVERQAPAVRPWIGGIVLFRDRYAVFTLDEPFARHADEIQRPEALLLDHRHRDAGLAVLRDGDAKSPAGELDGARRGKRSVSVYCKPHRASGRGNHARPGDRHLERNGAAGGGNEARSVLASRGRSRENKENEKGRHEKAYRPNSIRLSQRDSPRLQGWYRPRNKGQHSIHDPLLKAISRKGKKQAKNDGRTGTCSPPARRPIPTCRKDSSPLPTSSSRRRWPSRAEGTEQPRRSGRDSCLSDTAPPDFPRRR